MPSRPKSKSRGKSVARIATSFPRKKKRNLRKKTRAADGANTKSGGQKGGQDQGIRATIHASVPARLMRKGKKLLYYAAGGGDGNFLGFKVERKSAGGRFAPVDPAHVKVGLVIVRDAKSPIDPAKAEVMKVFQVERNGKREEKGNPVHRVHGHPDRFQVKGGTSSSHKEKCFFAVKVSVVSGEGSDATTISTIANFSPSDGHPQCDRIWLMSKMPKKESDATKSVAPSSASSKRKRDEMEKELRQKQAQLEQAHRENRIMEAEIKRMRKCASPSRSSSTDKVMRAEFDAIRAALRSTQAEMAKMRNAKLSKQAELEKMWRVRTSSSVFPLHMFTPPTSDDEGDEDGIDLDNLIGSPCVPSLLGRRKSAPSRVRTSRSTSCDHLGTIEPTNYDDACEFVAMPHSELSMAFINDLIDNDFESDLDGDATASKQ
eukprot:g491.t1